VFKDSVILEHDTMSLVYWSRCVTIMILFASLDLEGEGSMFLQNVRNWLQVTWSHTQKNGVLTHPTICCAILT